MTPLLLRLIRLVLALGLAWGSPLAQAAYTVNGDGTVTDTDTGLVWEQCVQGVYSSGSLCDSGRAMEVTWEGALALVTARNQDNHLGHNDWRLPNKNELESIVNLGNGSPAIDTTAFPNTPWSYTWTSTSYAPDSLQHAWVVYFGGGAPNAIPKSSAYPVRLVRGGRAMATFDTLASGGNGGSLAGTVTDPATGLMWDRCVLGLFSASGVCDTGSAAQFSWDAALAEVSARNFAKHQGYSDWRLPNKNELESIVTLGNGSPAIDTTVFPNTPTGSYTWTSTSYAPDNLRQAWAVYFGGGAPNAVPKTSTYPVRLVRGGQAMATFDTFVVHGGCGTAHSTTLVANAPSSGLCATGTAANMSAGATAYTWVCTGSGGGTDSDVCRASRGYTVTPSVTGGAGQGSISPDTAQVVAYNEQPRFTVTTQSGHAATLGGSCGGALNGNTYTTRGVTAPCTVTARFAPYTEHTGTPPGGSTVSARLSGAAGCAFATAAYQGATTVGSALPAGYTFPHGVLAFTTTSQCGTGVTVTLTYPSALPAGAKFFKYGPPTTGASPTWYEHPATLSADRTTLTYTVSDNGPGDNDPTVGVIRDPAGAGVPGGGDVSGVPTLSEWALLLLAGLLGVLGLHQSSRGRKLQKT
ncbi:Lcl C-terminal domain-containing protein [Hydrogenophaga soli]